MTVGYLLFLQEQIKDIIIIQVGCYSVKCVGAADHSIVMRSPCAGASLDPRYGLFLIKISQTLSLFLVLSLSLGLWSMVFLDYMGLRKALRAVIRMLAGQVGTWQRSRSLPLQCRQ